MWYLHGKKYRLAAFILRSEGVKKKRVSHVLCLYLLSGMSVYGEYGSLQQRQTVS